MITSRFKANYEFHKLTLLRRLVKLNSTNLPKVIKEGFRKEFLAQYKQKVSGLHFVCNRYHV